jgi:hypothetical protein
MTSSRWQIRELYCQTVYTSSVLLWYGMFDHPIFCRLVDSFVPLLSLGLLPLFHVFGKDSVRMYFLVYFHILS